MLYLLWSLLNIAVFLFFIVICIRATKLIREKIGLFASIIFVFGLLSFVGNAENNSGNKEPNSNHVKTWKFASGEGLNNIATSFVDIDLEKTFTSTYRLSIKYGKDKQGQVNTPISANSSATGFVSGTNWKPFSIIVNQTGDNNKLEYHVNGIVEWKLLGATVYAQLKEYKGVAEVK